jgi:hypothetical protein
MDVVRLPTLPAVTDLDTAWRVMEKSRRSAVIIERKGSAFLIRAHEILEGIEADKPHLGKLPGTEVPVLGLRPKRRAMEGSSRRLVDLAIQDVRGLGAIHTRLPENSERETAAKPLLAAAGQRMALLEIRPGEALLLTGRETDAKPFTGGPKRCYCRNPAYGNGAGHGVDNGMNGASCPHGDGYKLICRR